MVPSPPLTHIYLLLSYVKSYYVFICDLLIETFIRLVTPPAALVQVDINIPALPALNSLDQLECEFGSFISEAVMVIADSQVRVTCSLPDPVEIPPTPDQQGRKTSVLIF